MLESFTAFALKPTKDTRAAYIGKTPFIVPEVTASGWLDYTVTEGPLRGLGLGAGLRYVGKSWADNENTLKVPAVTLVDAAIRYKIDDWSFAVNVTCVFAFTAFGVSTLFG